MDTGTAGAAAPGVRVVLQRCEAAELLLDNAATWASIGAGLVCYVSFGTMASEAAVRSAAKAVLQLPVASSDLPPARRRSLIELCRQAAGDATLARAAGPESSEAAVLPPPEMLVVPSAALTAKLKQGGKTVSYRGQCEKESSLQLYHLFVTSLREFPVELMAGGNVKPPPKSRPPQQPLCPPEEFFQTGGHAGRWSAYGADLIPTLDSAGEPVSKSQRKKLEKQLQKHREKYAKQSAAGADESAAHSTMPSAPVSQAKPVEPFLSDNGASGPLRVVCGTFGNMQGLRLTAELGPFTHTFDFS